MSRTVLRLRRGRIEQATSIARSRSRIQYAAVAKTKNVPMRISKATRPYWTAGIEELRARGEVVQPAIECHEEVVLDARRALRLLSEPVLGAERARHLVGRGRYDEPQRERDDPDEHGVMQQHADSARDSPALERLDARPDGGRDDHREEEERDDDAADPERSRQGQDSEDDERAHRDPARDESERDGGRPLARFVPEVFVREHPKRIPGASGCRNPRRRTGGVRHRLRHRGVSVFANRDRC